MKTLRSVGRWLVDWRNGATLVASIVAVVVLLTTVDAIAGRREAFEQLRSSRQAASRRIDLLQARIDELVADGEADTARVAQLDAEIDALRLQVQGLGGTPVVAPRPNVTTPRSTSPPPSSPTTTTTPPRTEPPGPGGAPPPTTQPPPPGPGAPPPDESSAVCRLLTVPIVCT